MDTYVALLFSITLDGSRRVVMTDLRAMAAALGLEEARTVVATGNLIFKAEPTPVPALEAALEASFAERFGRHVDFIVRTSAAWRRLVSANPFPELSRTDPAHVITRVMRDPVRPEIVEALEARRTGEERMSVVDGDLWFHFAHGVAGSRLASALAPHRAGVGTMRNWHTVRRIWEVIGGGGPQPEAR
jgi:uncharacterized protein (DUF1697 family)